MCCVGAKVMRPVGSNQAWHSPTYSYSNSTPSTFTRRHTWTQECRGCKTTMWREKGRTRSRRIMQRHGSCSFARKNQIKNNALKRQLQTSGDVTQLQLMWLCLIQITQMYKSSSICRSDGGGGALWDNKNILKAFSSELQIPRKRSVPLPHRLSHTDSSSKSPKGKYSASLFPEGSSNQNRWFGDHVSCSQLYVPALYATYIRFPHEETLDTIAASMPFAVNVKPNHGKIHRDVDYAQ